MNRKNLRTCIWFKKDRNAIKVVTTIVEVQTYFHQFSTSFIESNDGGFGNYPVAIIEMEDGKVEVVDADSIKFIS